MVTAKKKQAPASNKPTQSQTPPNEPITPITPVEEQTVDAMEAEVIAALIKSGTPYAEAKAQVQGGGEPIAIVETEPEKDKPPPVAPAKSNEYSADQQELMRQWQNIDEYTEYEVTFSCPAYIYQWVIRSTLQNAHDRNDPDFVIANFMVMLLKEQRAIDPTKGGTVHSVSSGAKDLFNPNTGKWD